MGGVDKIDRAAVKIKIRTYHGKIFPYSKEKIFCKRGKEYILLERDTLVIFTQSILFLNQYIKIKF